MLEVKNLTKTYAPKKGVPVVALNNVSLKIEEKGLVFILGKSGSGKSTLLNLLGGLDKYDEGDIVIKGKSTKDFTQGDFDSYRNTYVGFIFQEYNILDEFSVGANIALAIELQGRKASNEEVNRLLDTLDLQGYGNRRPNELSGGQKQRIAIARALVKNPDIILADEPTGALDSKTGIQIFDILKKLAEEKLVLVVSHDRDFAEWYGDRVIELADGKIISDISKTTITNGQAESSNVQYLEKEGLVVREGYKLTPKDLEMINHYLEREKSINISSKGEDEFYTRSVFVDTKESVEVKKYSSEFKMIKSRLPFKMAFKMGASGLSHKKIRLFFTILFSLVAFTLFGVTDSLAAYNKVDATVNSIIDGNIDSVAFAKTKTIETEGGYNRTINLSLSEENIAELNDGVGKEIGLSFKPVFTAGAGDYEGAFNMSGNFSSYNLGGYNPFYLDSISGFVEYTKEELTELGFSVIGEMPTKDNEIAVTSYIYDHFATKGYSYYYDDGLTPPIDIEGKNFTKYEDLIGKYINLRNYNLNDSLTFKVTAIVNTNLVEERYESLKTPQGDNYFLSEEFRTVIQYGFHGLGFVNSGFINKLIEDESTSGIKVGKNIYLYYASDVNQIWLSPQVVGKLESIDQEDVVFFNKDKTSLEEGDILVNYEEFKQIYQKDITYEDFTGKIYDFEVYKYENLVKEYAYTIENYTQAEANNFYLERFGTNEFSEEDKKYLYYEYLAYGEGRENNEYGEKSGVEFFKETLASSALLLNQISEINIQQELYSNYTYEQKTSLSKIVGVYLDPDYDYSNNPIIIDDDFYNEIESMGKPEPYKFALTKMPTNRDDIQKLAEFSILLEDGIAYPLRNSATPMLDIANDLVENVAQVFLYIGIAFAVFSALLLSNFIASSVSYKKREIGILRALGARSSDVFRIFFNESIIIGIINFFLASVSTFVVVRLINVSLRTEVGFTVTIFNFSIRQIIILLLISVFVALFASFLPVNRIARKKPVDAISNK